MGKKSAALAIFKKKIQSKHNSSQIPHLKQTKKLTKKKNE